MSDGSRSSDTIACGFPSLDKMLGGGFRRGDLIALGGDVASGKSALALAIAIRAATEGRRVAFLTGESSVERVLERVIAIEARTKIDDLRQGTLDDVARASAGAVALKLRETLPMIERIGGEGAAQVATIVSSIAELDLVVVDSLAALADGNRALDEDLATAVRELKRTAIGRDIAVLVSAPLPNLSSRADRRPTLDDFGALGAIKQHADVLLALFREELYEASRDITGATELLVRKNRNGPVGYIDLYFYAQWMRFEDMLDPDR
ncbi:MAG TPA: DnaB-like helicase C-terminal domain-containing protein [Gemmatimonadaceae bacterium]